MSQMTSRCENTVNTNIKRLNHSHFAKTTLENGLAAFEQTFSARKPRSLLSPAHSKPRGSERQSAACQSKHAANITPSPRQSSPGPGAWKWDGRGGVFLRKPEV